MKKLIILLFLLFQLVYLNSCSNFINQPIEPTPVEKCFEAESFDIGNLNIGQFVKIEKLYKDIEIKVERDKTKRFTCINSTVDINNDGENDNIHIDINEYKESTIKINNVTFSLNIGGFIDFKFADLYKFDEYLEFIIIEDAVEYRGYSIFRYNGKEIIHIGNIYDLYLVNNEKGLLLSALNTTSFLDPILFTGFFELQNNEIIYCDVDVSSFTSKEYFLSQDINPYFIETEKIPEKFENEYTDNHIYIKAGEKITVISVGEHQNGVIEWYFIELASGIKGKMYFYVQ